MWVPDSSGYQKWVANTPAQELSIFQGVFTTTFGGNTNLSPTSINGVFIQQLTNFGVDNEDTVTLLVSQIYNPEYASGQYLDCIAAWNDLEREPATYSSATCQLAGLPSIVIPAGTQAISIYGDIFAAQSNITLDTMGAGEGLFVAVESGPINCDANSINRILQPISGWDTINNNTDGDVGTNVQSDTTFRFERKYNLGVQSTGSQISMNSALGNTEGVEDFIVISNNTIAPYEYQGITVPVGCVYVAVYAPTVSNETIGNILVGKNSGGTPYYTTGTNTQDYIYVDPTYAFTIDASWDVPDTCPIQVDISYVDNPLLPSNIQTQIKNLIINNFNNGTATFPAVTMRQQFFVGQLTAGIENLGVVILSQTMQTVTDGTPGQYLWPPVVGDAGTSGKPTINAANINLTPVSV